MDIYRLGKIDAENTNYRTMEKRVSLMSDEVYKRLSVTEFVALDYEKMLVRTPYGKGARFCCKQNPRFDVYAYIGDDDEGPWITFIDPSVSVIPCQSHIKEKQVYRDDHGELSVSLDKVPELWLSSFFSKCSNIGESRGTN